MVWEQIGSVQEKKRNDRYVAGKLKAAARILEENLSKYLEALLELCKVLRTETVIVTLSTLFGRDSKLKGVVPQKQIA